MQIQPGDMIHVFDSNTGSYVPCQVLMRFSMIVDDPADFHRAYYANYVVYTDGTQDEDGCSRVYASTYDPAQEDPEFLPIQTEAEWTKIQQILEDAYQAAQETGQERSGEPFGSSPHSPSDPDLPF